MKAWLLLQMPAVMLYTPATRYDNASKAQVSGVSTRCSATGAVLLDADACLQLYHDALRKLNTIMHHSAATGSALRWGKRNTL
jgi:hypothetical protein